MTSANQERWKLTDTVFQLRKNLFDLTPRREHQIATIVSGSRQNPERFHRSLALIESAPRMRAQLERTVAVLNHFGFVESPIALELKRDIQLLLTQIEGHSEGKD